MTIDPNITPQDTVENKNDQVEIKPQEQNDPSPDIKTEENKENWKKFREKQKQERLALEQANKIAQEERERAEALRAALEAITSKNTPIENEAYEETEEQKIDKLVEKKLAEREKKFEQSRLEREKKELPEKISQVYPDFKTVCSDENVDYLKFHYPEIASAFNDLPDTFQNWSNVYKTIKKLVPNHNDQEDRKRIDQNLMKPKSISSQGMTTPTSTSPHILSEERKAQNWERMQRSLKGLSN